MTEAACLTCHNDDIILEKRYELSLHDHATMANSLSRGGRAGCGRCHSHENFRNYVETGEDMSLETVTGLTCESCHTLHDSEDVENFSYGLVLTGPQEFLTGGTESFGDNAASNLCLACHQPRRDYTAYDLTPDVPADSVFITSSHAGPHYGMMGSMLFGKGADDRNGTVALNQGEMAHTSVGCVSCHMSESNNHMFAPKVDNCTTCHSGAEDFDINGAATKMHDAIVAIEAKLVEKGWYEETDDGLHSLASSSSPLGMSGSEYTAFWNYNVIHADHGSVYHNPPYVKAIINNIEENLGMTLTTW
jgi:nitrate/TMAO reductase-like tetraheme cytochrome c subunit